MERVSYGEKRNNMRILIVTQKVDQDDSILGFFHRWLIEFAKRYEFVTVICLYEGKHSLPQNVKVLSLGKESRPSRFRYIVLFFRYIWEERDQYDTVLVHMNKEYVVLGGVFWKLFKKKILFWYNHPLGSMMANIGYKFADRVFYTSPQSFFSGREKSVGMPVGIDTEYFNTITPPNPFNIVAIGRIAPIKYNLEMVQALKLLVQDDPRYRLTFCGTFDQKEKEYYDKVFEEGKTLVASGNLVFHGSVPNNQLISVYESHGILLNLTPTGSFDKVMFEALSAKRIVVAFNRGFKDMYKEVKGVNSISPLEIEGEIERISKLDEKTVAKITEAGRRLIIDRHSLEKLVNEFVTHTS